MSIRQIAEFTLAAIAIQFGVIVIIAISAPPVDNRPKVELPRCQEDEAVLVIGQGDYNGAQWETYTVECLALDDYGLERSQ